MLILSESSIIRATAPARIIPARVKGHGIILMLFEFFIVNHLVIVSGRVSLVGLCGVAQVEVD